MAKSKYISTFELECIVRLKLDNDEFPQRYMVTEVRFLLNGGVKYLISSGSEEMEVFPNQLVLVDRAPEKSN